jgi:hypothetical protein
MSTVRRFDGVIGENKFSTTSTWYKIGLEHGREGREWSCRAAAENPYALIDYDAGYNAGRGEQSA